MKHKMRYRKCFTKTLAALLSAAMLFSAMGFSTMAEALGTEDIPSVSYTEEQNGDSSNLSTPSNASSEKSEPEFYGGLVDASGNESITDSGDPTDGSGDESITDSGDPTEESTESVGDPSSTEKGNPNPDATPSDAAPINQIVIIADFAQLDEVVMNQEVENGTTMDVLNLPETLEAYDAEGQPYFAPVSWESENFDGETTGTYTFTPVLPIEYEIAEEVSLPTIEVTVMENSELKENAIAIIESADGTISEFESLVAAVNAVPQNQENATTIQIVKDTTITEQINIEKKKIILAADEARTITFSITTSDINCFRVGNWSNSAASLTISGQLTITTTNSSLRSIVNVVKGGSFSLQDGIFSSGAADLSKAIACIDNGGSMTMSGGMIQGSKDHNSCGVMLQDTDDQSISFTMTGGMITNCSSTGRGGGVWVMGDAEFTMTNGTISNCSGQDGGGVSVTGTGSFTMDGGTITGCSATGRGGGVAVLDTAIFTMNGGQIKSCSSGRGNYVYQSQGATFDKEGGTVEDIDRKIVAKIGDQEYDSLQEAINAVPQKQENPTTIQIVNYITITEQVTIDRRNVELTADEKHTITFSMETEGGNCFRVSGAGSLIINSEKLTVTTTNSSIRTLVSVPSDCLFSLKSGTLSSGNAEVAKAIVCIDNGGAMKMSGGTIQGNSAHNSRGVYLQDTSNPSTSMSFIMEGGTITDCSIKNSDNTSGGGVSVVGNAEFTMTGNAVISGCSGQDGGGVAVSDTGTFVMDGGTITDCSATRYGGGVAVLRNATFTMDDGMIVDCSAETAGNYVYQAQTATFTQNGGNIGDIGEVVVAQIGSTQYTSLQEAILAVSEKQDTATEIKIINDIEIKARSK